MPGIDLLRRGLRYTRQHPWLALTGMLTVASALTLIALFALVTSNVQGAVAGWSRDFQIVIYLDPPPAEGVARQWQTALGSMAEVQEVTFVSSAEALRRFRARLGSDAPLLDGIGNGILPASFELTLRPEFRSRSAIDALVGRIVQKNEWRDLRYGREWLERFEAVVRLARLLGTGFGLFLLGAALLIVANTIRLIFLSRRTEIEILRLLGAPPLYIVLPFLIEGGTIGGVGGVAALLLTYGLYLSGLQQGLAALLHTLGVEQVIFLPWAWQVALVLAGTLLGLFGSLIALRRISRT